MFNGSQHLAGRLPVRTPPYSGGVKGKLYAGVAGFSYASWRGSFYPTSAKQGDFLRLYAERLPSVELVGVFYRIPPKETFARWASETPGEFRFGIKMNRRLALFGNLALAPDFVESISVLGEKLGPVRAQLARARDDGFLQRLLGALPPGIRLAVDLPDESWEAPEVDALLEAAGAARVNALDSGPGFRYLRLRDPPYDDDALADLAASLRPLLADGIDIYCYFKHEDEPRGALYAERLLQLLPEYR